MKGPRRLAGLAALCGAVALAGWAAAGLAGLGLPSIESTGAPLKVSRPTSATARAEHVDAPQATPLSKDVVSVTDLGSGDRKSTRLNSSHIQKSRMPSSA